MSKRRVRSTGGARKPSGERWPPEARPPVTGGSKGGRRRRSRPASGPGRANAGASRGMARASVPATGLLTWAAIVTAAALLAVSAVAYDPDLVGTYFVPRAAISYPLIALAVVLCVIVVRPGARAFRVDLVDVLALAFCAWVVLGAALSPAPAPAWFGYYNRGTGAFFWVATVGLFLVARRLLGGRRAEQALAIATAALLALGAGVALAQAGGAETWWGAAGVVDGRVTGTTGNPVTLAGFCLLGVWLATLALEGTYSLWLRLAAGAGAAAAGVCLVMGVSRAAYLGALAVAVVLVVVWARRRAWRRLAAVGAIAAVALAGAAAYAPSGDGSPSLLGRLRDWRVDGALNQSDAKRVDLWAEALSAAADRPVVGYGAGAFVVADRLYRPPERRVMTPWALASDPHSLPLLVLATTGAIGLGLGLATIVVASLAVRGRREAGADDEGEEGPPSGAPSGERGASTAGGDAVGLARSGWNGVAALVYVVAAGVFLLVSPFDKVVAFPVALIGGALLGPPAPAVWGRVVPAARGAAGRVVWAAVLTAAAALLASTIVPGVQFWRADAAFADAARVDAPTRYARAADLFTWEPFYSLEAGGRVWRAGLATDDAAEVDRGRALVARGIDRDPTGPLGYADLARLAIAKGDPEEAVARARLGLRWNPDHPVLQALWGYAALLATSRSNDVELGARLAAGLEALPASTPDAWYWLSEVRRAGGDAAGAAQARARAKELGPKLTAHRYEERLLAR